MSNSLPSAGAHQFTDAIRSGRVYCHCLINRELPTLIHDPNCLWQMYMEQIYRIGRLEDEEEEVLFASALSEQAKILSAENRPGSGGPDYLRTE